MTYLSNRVYDNGLTTVAEATEIVVCNALPTTYAAANSTNRLGGKLNPTVSAPQNRPGGGRQVEIGSVSDGDITVTGSATHWALIDSANNRLLAAQDLTTSQAVTAGNTFSLSSFTIGIPSPA